MLRCALITFLSFSLCYYFTPVLANAAKKLGIVAKPDGKLRVHHGLVPYLGGLSIYLSFLLALVFGFGFDQKVLGLLLGGTIILIVGLIDDFGVMSPGMKLFGQIVAIIAFLKSGIRVEIEAIAKIEPFVTFPVISYFISGFWLLIVCNALNFLDIEDGLAGGVSLVSSAGLMAVSLVNNNLTIASLTASLLGAIGGFIIYNYPPAKIYLGDAGSLFLGMMLGALAMIGSYTQKSAVGLVTPVLILGVAIFEISFTTFARMLKGIPIMYGSKDHIAKRLQKIGFSLKKTIWTLYLLEFALAGIGITVMFSSDLTGVALVGITLLLLGSLSIALLRIKME